MDVAGSSFLGKRPSPLAVLAKMSCPVGTAVGRGVARERAICQAVVDLVNESSYESVTMDAVAARAKASKATIYRRWANKDDLLIDALQRVFDERSDALPDTGTLRNDLLTRINQQTREPKLLNASKRSNVCSIARTPVVNWRTRSPPRWPGRWCRPSSRPEPVWKPRPSTPPTSSTWLTMF